MKIGRTNFSCWFRATDFAIGWQFQSFPHWGSLFLGPVEICWSRQMEGSGQAMTALCGHFCLNHDTNPPRCDDCGAVVELTT